MTNVKLHWDQQINISTNYNPRVTNVYPNQTINLEFEIKNKFLLLNFDKNKKIIQMAKQFAYLEFST